MGYLTVSEGYRIGDANGLSLCEPVPEGEEPSQNVCASEREFQYFPDSTTNYEIGLRTQWLNRRLTINGSLFYIDWQDPQLATATLIGQAPIRINGNGAKSQGGELSFNAQLTDRFSIRASYSYTQAELTEDTPHLVRTIEPPGFGATLDEAFDGDRLPGSPEHQGSLYATYTLPISSAWELGLNYGVAAISDVFTRIGNRGGGEALPGFALHSASVVLSNDAWTIALYAKNLFNKYAETGVRTTPLYLQTVTDENGESVHVRSYSKDVVRPREVGLRATYKFDL
jgi:outer membrane receptor protein involved in Fe transport